MFALTFYDRRGRRRNHDWLGSHVVVRWRCRRNRARGYAGITEMTKQDAGQNGACGFGPESGTLKAIRTLCVNLRFSRLRAHMADI